MRRRLRDQKGNPEALREYWRQAINWGHPGDFDECVAAVGKYIDDPEGYCALRHHEATGAWPGHASGERKDAIMKTSDLHPAAKKLSPNKLKAYLKAFNKAKASGLHPKMQHNAGMSAAKKAEDNATMGVQRADAPWDVQQLSLARQDAYVNGFNRYMEENPTATAEDCDKAARAVMAMVKDDDSAQVIDVEVTELQAFDAGWEDASQCIRSTPDGFLVCTPRVARTGIQLYRGFEVGRPDMDVVRVYRPPESVFDKKAMSSLAWKTITLDHPFENINSKNWKEHAVGLGSGDVARDGEYIRVPMTLMDQSAIDAVDAGTAQLSVGYSAKLVWGDGNTDDGEPYNAMQTEIRGNHIAVVSAARGGDMLKIGDQGKKKSKLKNQPGQEPGDEPEAKPDYENEDENEDSVIMGGSYDAKKPPPDDDEDNGKDDDETDDQSEEDAMSADASVCPDCDGDGKDPDDDEKTCPTCGGDGFVGLAAKSDDAAKKPDDEGDDNEGDDGDGDEPNGKKKGNGDDDTEDGYGDKDYSTEARKQMAKSGQAMPHGGYPIKNEGDLKNAIQAVGRAKNPSATRAHIKSRARALGKSSLIPESWDHRSRVIRERSSEMTTRIVNIDGVQIELDDKDGQILERHLSDVHEKLDKATSQLAVLKKQSATRDGEMVALKKQLADAEITPAKINQMVRDRTEVIERARRVLGDKVQLDDNRPDTQIRREVVAELYGNQAAKEMNDDAISGAFYAGTAKGNGSNGSSALRDVASSFSNGSAQIHSSQDASNAAWEARNKRLADAWKTPPRMAREAR